MQPLFNDSVALVETDVSLGGRTTIVCDAHDLPFADETFDAVVVQAVLEHVVDPSRCVQEIHRVLRSDGLVYAETPFMQQVHGGKYDFTRFTPLGHRRLFRYFAEIDAGAVAGPATVLAWSYWYFLRGFAHTRNGAQAAAVVARLTAFWLKYLDRLTVGWDSTQDGSWGCFFLGRKASTALSDRDLLALYRGLGSTRECL
jgi:SAM-dependent methyltransferase